jgi:hypothetical protein
LVTATDLLSVLLTKQIPDTSAAVIPANIASPPCVPGAVSL